MSVFGMRWCGWVMVRGLDQCLEGWGCVMSV